MKIRFVAKFSAAPLKTMKPSTGFTLIELVTVVVIVSILIGFGMPAYNRAREVTRFKEVRTILGIMVSAQKIYRTENGHYYPSASPPTIFVNDLALINKDLNINIGSATGIVYRTCNDGGLFVAQALFATFDGANFNIVGYEDGQIRMLSCAGLACAKYSQYW